MSTNVTSQSPFLRTTRHFPQDPQPLSVELSKSYLDIASFVNARTIGTYAVNAPSITGNQFFTSGLASKRQSLRQIYTFTSSGTIPHGINFQNVTAFVQIYGTFTEGTNWYPIPYVNTVNVINQISIRVDSTNIVIIAGAGAPAIVSGIVNLEWLTNV